MSATTKTTTLVFVRHGKTHWNEEGLLQGHLDVEGSQLTDRGKEEARLLGMSFSNKAFDAVFSSDLGRALTTAKICLSTMKSCSGDNNNDYNDSKFFCDYRYNIISMCFWYSRN